MTWALISCGQPGEVAKVPYYRPWADLEEMFRDVQIARVYPDSKTFVDCVPKRDPALILADYRAEKDGEGFDLKAFVKENFHGPEVPEWSENKRPKFDAGLCAGCNDPSDGAILQHLHYLWEYLERPPGENQKWTTLIPLKNRYVVPGGRFREIYYWDSYFTMIGLGVSGKTDLIESMIDNFAFLIDSLGFVPNGNRSYYLGRSQPPFFASMVNLFAQLAGNEKSLKYLGALQSEYDFWMDGADGLSLSGDRAAGHVVLTEDGTILNRYWDKLDFPRPESYREDFELAEGMPPDNRKVLYRNLRAGATSGWDYSTRWFADKSVFQSIRTTEILPVDLNCLMFQMEKVLSQLYAQKGNEERASAYSSKAETRKAAIQKYFWNDSLVAFSDYLWTEARVADQLTLAGNFPLYFKIATDAQAKAQAKVMSDQFLSPGGLPTTLIQSGQQWDAPNGWAPLQWIAIKGLEHYAHEALAKEIAGRWIRLNKKVFAKTGRMMEKYNVMDTTLLAGGGEYPTQDGFGWTNGVLLGLMADNPSY